MEKIVYLDCYTVNPGDLDWGELGELGNLVCYERTEAADVVARIGDARIVITNKVRLGEETFAACPQLKLICVAATGYDVVDVKAARSHGITVCNCAGYSTKAVGQTVVAHLLEVCNQDFSVLDFRYRNIPKLDDPGTSHNLLQHVSLLFIP